MTIKSLLSTVSLALLIGGASVTAQAQIAIGHLADYSGGTSDVGTPYGQGVADTFADPRAAARWRARAGSIAHPACAVLWASVAVFFSSSAALPWLATGCVLVHVVLGAIDRFNLTELGKQH